MKQKYLIALDLDGTLLTDKKTITPKTQRFFNKLYKKGHHIVIATGRPLRAAFEFQKKLGIEGPLVTHNGVFASHPLNSDFPRLLITFDHHVLQNIVAEIGYDKFENLMVETEKTVYLLHQDEELNNFFWNDRGNIKYGDPFLHLNEHPLTLIFLFKRVTPTLKEEITRIVKKHSDYKIRFWANSPYAELYQENGTKKNGLIHVANSLNIDRENVIACGDFYNDYEMLEWAGHSILMKNGARELRSIAKYITEKDNNNDGLIAPIKKILRK